jgi:hypothetical protein
VPGVKNHSMVKNLVEKVRSFNVWRINAR